MLRRLLLLAALCSTQPIQAQEVALSGSGPRFLLAAYGRQPVVEIDPARAPLFQRRVTLSLEHATVGEALRAVGRQAGIRLVYSRDVLDPSAPTRIKADGITVAGALTEILLGAGVDVVLADRDRVILTPRALASPPPVGTITGKVTDVNSGAPVELAEVLLEGTSRRVLTAADGSFRFENVDVGGHVIVVRRIGFSRQSRTVTVEDGQEVIVDFALQPAATTLEEVVVTGTIVETERKALPNPITVITADDIREKNIQRVEQLFRGDVPGAFSFDKGIDDDISRVFIRGASDLAGLGQIKTYVDGVQITDANFLSLIDPSMIERIELIRGPQASTIYGSQALNGVLQIFTKKGFRNPQPVVEGGVSAGVAQTRWADQEAAPTYRGNLTLMGGGDGYSYNVGATRLYRGEWVTNYRDAENGAFGGFRVTQKWLTAELSGRIQHQNRTLARTPFFQPFEDIFQPPREQHGNYQTTGVGLTLRARTTSFWEQALTIGAERFQQEFVTEEPRAAGDSLSTFDYEALNSTIRFTSAVQGQLTPALAGNVVAGVEQVHKKSTTQGGAGPRNTGDFVRDVFASRMVNKTRGAFLQAQLGVRDQLFFTAGLRAEDDPFFGEDYGLSWSPRAGVSYVRELGAITIKPRFSYGKSIRPPFEAARQGGVDLTSNGITLANPDIGPESQQGFDVGFEVYAGDRLSLDATYYDQNVNDLIDQVIVQAGSPEQRQFQNVGKIKNRGIELQATVGLVQGLSLSGTYNIATSEVREVSPDYTGDLAVGDQLLGVPKYSGGATLRYAAAGWTAQVGVRASSSWSHYVLTDYYNCLFLGSDCRNTTGALREYVVQYPGITKFRLGISRALNDRVTARLDVENLGNNYRTEELDTQTPMGRVTTVGLDFRL